MNPAFAAMHGWTVESFGASRWTISPPAGRDEFPGWTPAFDERGHRIWETERLRRNGMIFPALIDATAVKDADGQRDLLRGQRAGPHRAAPGRGAGSPGPEDGGRGPAGRRRGPRLQQHADDHHGLQRFLLTTLERDDPRWADADEIRKAAERAMHLTRQLLAFGRQQLVARHVLSLNEVVSRHGADAAAAPGRGHRAGDSAIGRASAASRPTTASWSRW